MRLLRSDSREIESTFQVRKSTGVYPALVVEGGGRGVVSHGGGVVLTQAARVTGLDRALAQALAPWRLPGAVHDPGKIMLDLAIALALGGDCLSDIGILRAEPGVFGPVASDPTVSRLIAGLAADGHRVLAALRAALATARGRAWALAGQDAPDQPGSTLTVDLDATLLDAHSEKEHAAATCNLRVPPVMGVHRPRDRRHR